MFRTVFFISLVYFPFCVVFLSDLCTIKNDTFTPVIRKEYTTLHFLTEIFFDKHTKMIYNNYRIPICLFKLFWNDTVNR